MFVSQSVPFRSAVVALLSAESPEPPSRQEGFFKQHTRKPFQTFWYQLGTSLNALNAFILPRQTIVISSIVCGVWLFQS